ncbi:MAG: sugar ABC transporter permease [Bacteroidetes bacterium]|nr:sugar ABC transporter permease [Bacteroidota bacterium]
MSLKRSQGLEGFLFILPYAVIWFLFLFLPLVFGLIISLFDWNPLGESVFIGLDNYRELFSNHRFWNSFWVTWKFILMVIPGIIISALIAALILHFIRFSFKNFFESAIFFPYLLNVSIVSIIWGLMNDPSIGILSHYLQKFGLFKMSLLSSNAWALPVVAITTIWWLAGYRMIVFRAALSSIPEEIYEAAKIDGSGPIRTFAIITLPLIKPSLLFALILTTVGGMRTFGQVVLMTSGGPGVSTEVMALQMYRLGFEFLDFGRAAAVGFIIFLLIFFISMVFVKFFKLGGDLR